MSDPSSSTPTPSQDEQLKTSDAYLLALKQIDLKKDLSALPTKPCARQSLLLGIGGGVAVGAIRFLSSRRPLASSNWAVATFGVLSLTSWETCRRSYAAEQLKMRSAMQEYRAKARVKQQDQDQQGQRKEAKEGRQGKAPGGILMGQRGMEMMEEKAKQKQGQSASASGERLV